MNYNQMHFGIFEILLFFFKVIAGTVISHYTKINEKFDVEVVGHIPVG